MCVVPSGIKPELRIIRMTHQLLRTKNSGQVVDKGFVQMGNQR